MDANHYAELLAKQSYDRFESMYNKIRDLDSLKYYIKDLEYLEEQLDPEEELEEFWTLLRIARVHGEDITDNYYMEDLKKINYCISEYYSYKDYIFGLMQGQGSRPWYAHWNEYSHILNNLKIK